MRTSPVAAACAIAAALAPSVASAAPYTKAAPPVDQYIQSLGFSPPTNPAANLDAHSPEQHTQLEAYLLEGADAGALTGDPVLLAWFGAADASLAPWHLTNCGDTNYAIDYDCPWGTIWQVGLGCQVTDDYKGVATALAKTHPGESAQVVGQSVLDLAAQTKVFPPLDPATMAANPAGITGGMSNGYWLATLMRDMRVGSYLEAPPATNWPCYVAGAPAWCGYYKTHKQEYSDVLSEVIVSWNQIQADWAAAITPDVIVDDMSPGFSITGTVTGEGLGGWRGHFFHAPPAAPSAPTVTATYEADLAAGTWRVSGFVPHSKDAVAKVELTVVASDGPHQVALDESQLGGRFYALGEFHFAAGKATVTMSNGATNGEVGWDALRFHALSLDPPAPGTTSSTGATGATSGSGGAGSGAGGHGPASTGSGGGASAGGCSCELAGAPASGTGGLAALLLLAARRLRLRRHVARASGRFS